MTPVERRKFEVQVLKFLLLPLIFGLSLAIWAHYGVSVDGIVLLFIANFIVFFGLFGIRAIRHRTKFIATITVAVGMVFELAVLYIWPPIGVVTWAFALYLVMLFVVAVTIAAGSIALKAFYVIKEHDNGST